MFRVLDRSYSTKVREKVSRLKMAVDRYRWWKGEWKSFESILGYSLLLRIAIPRNLPWNGRRGIPIVYYYTNTTGSYYFPNKQTWNSCEKFTNPLNHLLKLPLDIGLRSALFGWVERRLADVKSLRVNVPLRGEVPASVLLRVAEPAVVDVVVGPP